MSGVEGCSCDAERLCGACLDEMTADREAARDEEAQDRAEQSAFEAHRDGDA